MYILTDDWVTINKHPEFDNFSEYTPQQKGYII